MLNFGFLFKIAKYFHIVLVLEIASICAMKYAENSDYIESIFTNLWTWKHEKNDANKSAYEINMQNIDQNRTTFFEKIIWKKFKNIGKIGVFAPYPISHIVVVFIFMKYVL